jgi:hypothetical protein
LKAEDIKLVVVRTHESHHGIDKSHFFYTPRKKETSRTILLLFSFTPSLLMHIELN